MKKIILIASLAFACLSVFAQEVQIDNRLLAKYPQEELDRILQANPLDIEYLNWMLDNAFEIKNISGNGAAKYPKLKFLDKETKSVGCEETVYNPETFNIMNYDFAIEYDKSTIYVIGNTQIAVVFYSGKFLNKMFNQFKTKNNE